MDLKKGDVVQLKSGGPKMTVAEVELVGIACTWFVEAKLVQALFSPEMLKIADAREVGSWIRREHIL